MKDGLLRLLQAQSALPLYMISKEFFNKDLTSKNKGFMQWLISTSVK